MSMRLLNSILGLDFFRTEEPIKDSLSATKASGISVEVDNSKAKYFLDANEILSKPQCAYCVKQIKEIAGLNDEVFETYYMPALKNFAVLCQDIGASERYHHAYPYGLIEHSLEVAMYAMRKSQGCVYYPDGNVESIQWLERVFMYSVFCAALLHDGGKIYTNTRWKVLNTEGEWILWTPLLHKTPQGVEKIEYRTESLRNSANKNIFLKHSHELFASHLLLEVIPRKGIDWIVNFSNEYGQELYIHFLHALASDYENASDIGVCVKAADQKSTEDAVKRHHLSSSTEYVDFSDPNLPLHESFREVFKEIFSNPESFHLHVNKVAMGKFSHIERFGNLIFVVAKSVIPIVVKRLKEKNIKIPNDQAIFSLLADNGLTLPAPSGDTLWWVEFYSNNNNNKRKEMSYLVFNALDYSNVDIKDLRSIGVECNISPKSLGLMLEKKNSTEETLAAEEKLFELFYPDIDVNEVLIVGSGDADTKEFSEISTDFVHGGQENPNQSSISVSDAPNMKPETVSIKNQNIEPSAANVDSKPERSLTALNGPKEKQNNLSESQKITVPNQIVEPKSVKTSKPSKANNPTVEAGQSKKKSSTKFALGLDKALGGVTVASTPKVATEKAKKTDTTELKDTVEPQSSVDGVCYIPPTPEQNTGEQLRNSFIKKKIEVWPNTLDLGPEKLSELMQSKIPKSTTIFSTDDAIKKSEEIHTRWLPYLSELIEKGIITANHPKGAVINTNQGLFIAKEPLSEVLDEKICKHLFEVLLNSSLAISTDGVSTEHSFTNFANETLSGALLATRHMLVSGRRLPLATEILR